MAGSYESNPNLQKASSSKKSKGSGKSGKSGDSGKRKKKVQFAEEPSSKRQRVEDDYSVYISGPLETVSPAFENRNPYLLHGIFVDLEKLEDLGYDLSAYLQKYMTWLGIQNEYNVQVLRVFYESLSAKAKYKNIGDNISAIGRIDFKATLRGRKIKFNWRDINRFLGVTDEEMNKWIFPEKLDQTELALAYGTEGKKVSGMPDTQRVLQYIYSRIMANKGGNFNEFTQLDNPWLAKFLTQKPINPGQLISMELNRWVEGRDNRKASLPYPQFIAFLLEQFNIKFTEEADNKKCLPMGSMNLGKMGVRYIKPVKPTQSGSQARSASHNTVPSASGAGDQEADSH